MKDLTIELENRPGALAEMGEMLGRAGVSIEGGGAWLANGTVSAHFLFHDGAAATRALAAAGIRVLAETEVLLLRLNQEEPGQLGKISRRLAEAGINIEVMYSDHNHQLVLVVDDLEKAEKVSDKMDGRAEHKVKEHNYNVTVQWTGNDGQGTTNYRSYRRDHVISAGLKPEIPGSSDPAFRGNPERYNPEELLVAALSSCHMLSYLHLCAIHNIVVAEYKDEAQGAMQERPNGSGAFTHVVLRPKVTISSGDRDKAVALHHDAHQLCFIANSVNFPVEVEPAITAVQPASM